jgi:hypothetical protein
MLPYRMFPAANDPDFWEAKPAVRARVRISWSDATTKASAEHFDKLSMLQKVFYLRALDAGVVDPTAPFSHR